MNRTEFYATSSEYLTRLWWIASFALPYEDEVR